ncbi:MAG: MotA/TolQ/ExbB proton channel family protein [Candidatus Omnitrophota bacterium]
MSLWQMLQLGGGTVIALMCLSVISLAVIIERVILYYRSSRVRREMFMVDLSDQIRRGNIIKARELCHRVSTPFASVAAAGLVLRGNSSSILDNAMERQITIETIKLERRIAIIGTIASTSVYIGLFGTVLGIIRAFQDIAQQGAGGMAVVINGIAEALVCTAVGLCVAVPAVMAFNYCQSRIERFVMDMDLVASETRDLISEGTSS